MPLAKEKNLAYYAELTGHLGCSISFQKRYDDAHKAPDLAIPILSDEMIIANIWYYLERGRVHYWQLNRTKATPCFEKAVELAKRRCEKVYLCDHKHLEEALIHAMENVARFSKSHP